MYQLTPQSHYVSCITTEFIGGVEIIKFLWEGAFPWTEAQMITAIDAQTDVFFASAYGYTTLIHALHTAWGNHLRTSPNGTPLDNLLALPRC